MHATTRLARRNQTGHAHIQRGALWRTLLTLAAFAAAMGLTIGLSSAGASAQNAGIDPTGLTEVPDLPTNTIVRVGTGVPNGLLLEGAGVVGGCQAPIHWKFVATDTETPVWVNDNDEYDVALISSPVDNPTSADLTCESLRDYGPAGYIDGDYPGGGFGGTLDTEVGHTYWLAIWGSDNKDIVSFATYPGDNMGERDDLLATPSAEDRVVAELVEPRYDGQFRSIEGVSCAGEIRMSFIATRTETIVTTDDHEHLIGLFTSDRAQPAIGDLHEVACEEADWIGNAHTMTAPTTIGQRYWITLDTDDPSARAFILLNEDDFASESIGTRMELLRQPDISTSKGFIEAPSQFYQGGLTTDCGTVIGSFTSGDSLLWAENNSGQFEVLESPVDPRLPEWSGLETARACSSDWSAPSDIGSVTADLQTERNTRYWLVWSSPQPTSIRIDPPIRADYFHTTQVVVNGGGSTLAAQCRDDAGEVVVRASNLGGTQPLYVQVLLDNVLQDADAISQLETKQFRISGISNGEHTVTVIDPFDGVSEVPFTVDCQPGDFERNFDLPRVTDDSVFDIGRPAPAWHPGYCGAPSYVRYTATSTRTEIEYSGSDGTIIFANFKSCTTVPLDGAGSVEIDTAVGSYYFIGFEGAEQAQLTINPARIPSIEVSPSGDPGVDCTQDGGQVTFTVSEVSRTSVHYTVVIALDGNTTDEFEPIPGIPRRVTVRDMTDGPHTVAVSTPYQEFLYDFDVDCVPPESEAIQLVTSCAAGNVRVDVIIVNEADASKVYFADFEHTTTFDTDVSLRKSVLVGANGQGRISITGRPSYQTITVTVTTGGDTVAEFSTFDECNVLLPLTNEHNIVVTSSCLAGNGLIRYVIVNPSEFSRVWRIGFGDLRLRTTSADARAAGYGGISGRPDGDFPMRILLGDDVIWEGTVTVDCDS